MKHVLYISVQYTRLVYSFIHHLCIYFCIHHCRCLNTVLCYDINIITVLSDNRFFPCIIILCDYHRICDVMDQNEVHSCIIY